MTKDDMTKNIPGTTLDATKKKYTKKGYAYVVFQCLTCRTRLCLVSRT